MWWGKLGSFMETRINPKDSKLGVKTVKYEVVRNATGVLAVTFRYRPEGMAHLTDGVQMQFETINVGAKRGGHYHFPESAAESFYIIKGDCDLIVCDLDRTICEVYSLESEITYTVPGMIVHQAVNMSNENEVEMVVAKPFNFEIVNRTTMFDMSWTNEIK